MRLGFTIMNTDVGQLFNASSLSPTWTEGVYDGGPKVILKPVTQQYLRSARVVKLCTENLTCKGKA